MVGVQSGMPCVAAGHADGQQAGAERVLPEDEGRAAGRAALLRVGSR